MDRTWNRSEKDNEKKKGEKSDADAEADSMEQEVKLKTDQSAMQWAAEKLHFGK